MLVRYYRYVAQLPSAAECNFELHNESHVTHVIYASYPAASKNVKLRYISLHLTRIRDCIDRIAGVAQFLYQSTFWIKLLIAGVFAVARTSFQSWQTPFETALFQETHARAGK